MVLQVLFIGLCAGCDVMQVFYSATAEILTPDSQDHARQTQGNQVLANPDEKQLEGNLFPNQFADFQGHDESHPNQYADKKPRKLQWWHWQDKR